MRKTIISSAFKALTSVIITSAIGIALQLTAGATEGADTSLYEVNSMPSSNGSYIATVNQGDVGSFQADALTGWLSGSSDAASGTTAANTLASKQNATANAINSQIQQMVNQSVPTGEELVIINNTGVTSVIYTKIPNPVFINGLTNIMKHHEILATMQVVHPPIKTDPIEVWSLLPGAPPAKGDSGYQDKLLQTALEWLANDRDPPWDKPAFPSLPIIKANVGGDPSTDQPWDLWKDDGTMKDDVLNDYLDTYYGNDTNPFGSTPYGFGGPGSGGAGGAGGTGTGGPGTGGPGGIGGPSGPGTPGDPGGPSSPGGPGGTPPGGTGTPGLPGMPDMPDMPEWPSEDATGSVTYEDLPKLLQDFFDNMDNNKQLADADNIFNAPQRPDLSDVSDEMIRILEDLIAGFDGSEWIETVTEVLNHFIPSVEGSAGYYDGWLYGEELIRTDLLPGGIRDTRDLATRYALLLAYANSLSSGDWINLANITEFRVVDEKEGVMIDFKPVNNFRWGVTRTGGASQYMHTAGPHLTLIFQTAGEYTITARQEAYTERADAVYYSINEYWVLNNNDDVLDGFILYKNHKTGTRYHRAVGMHEWVLLNTWTVDVTPDMLGIAYLAGPNGLIGTHNDYRTNRIENIS